ncbi:MAG TPA: pilus assembly protein TadG-related protein [Gemmataceae bacterium]|nr:pilus assembly protein TadG-related protein [Gemmataceae bacterium]
MRKPLRTSRRDGAVLPLVTISLIGLLAFVALAVDVGLMAVARTQAQSAADVAALAGARTLDGTPGNNRANAEAEAREAARANHILGQGVTVAQVTTVQAGVYKYNTTSLRFVTDFQNPPAGLEAYGAMRVVINADQQTYFGRFLGVNSMKVAAVATAVHRPRDVHISLDFSGSMKFASEYNYPPTVSGSIDISGVLNADPRFPRFGPWKLYPLATAGNPNPMQRLERYVDSGGETHAVNNLTVESDNGPPIVQNFQTNAGSPGTNAFVYDGDLTGASFNIANTPVCTPTPEAWGSQYASGYVGDRWPLRAGLGTTNPAVADYARHPADLFNISTVNPATRDAAFELNGYDDARLRAYKNGPLVGYSMGPGYMGKTFYMWPPDPRYTAGAEPTNISATNPLQDAGGRWIADWRKRFFLYPSASSGTKGAPMDDNSRLWTTAAPVGEWQSQNLTGNPVRYVPNYDAILKWIKSGPQTLPPALRAGRVLYYSAIPDSIPVNWQTGLITSGATDDQRFWKDYIDFVIGAGKHARDKTLAGAGTNNTWNGSDFGTPKITPRALLTGTTRPYMAYDDVPVHPRQHLWFGPTTMLGFLSVNSNNSDYNWYAGTTYEAQTWQLKAGIKAAIDDIRKNHPNDLAAIGFWSNHNGYNMARVNMGKDYDKMQRVLYYPFSIVNGTGGLGNTGSEKRPYAQSNPSTSSPSGISVANYQADVPNGDGGTNPAMGLMVAYNQFNWAGPWKGRKGAAKVVILETDGVANQTCNGTLGALTGAAGRKEWTGISTASSVGNGHPDALDYALSVAHILCNDETGSKPFPTTLPAYSNPGSPVPSAGNPMYRFPSQVGTAGPGFSTTRSPAQIHALAFGELFEPASVSPMKVRALEFLRNLQVVGNTSPAGATSIESYKIITGTSDARIAKIKEALERIMQGGIQVALVE